MIKVDLSAILHGEDNCYWTFKFGSTDDPKSTVWYSPPKGTYNEDPDKEVAVTDADDFHFD